MCSIGFNSQFGTNIKQLQHLNQTKKFGATVRTGGGTRLNQALSKDYGVFTADRTNFFQNNRVSVSQKYTHNGVEYNNAYAMLNTMNSGQKASGSGFSLKMLFDFVKTVINMFKGGGTEKSKGADKALGDIQNAQTKDSLKAAVDSGIKEQGQIENQQKRGEQALKGFENNANQAGKAEQEAEAKVNQSNEQLSGNEAKLEQAKADYNSALDAVENAQLQVASAENNLAAAKNAATPENPNTAAIQQAEAQLQQAKQAEINARKQLQQAEQAQTQAQQAVDASKQQVEAATSEQAQAAQNADAANEQVAAATSEQESIQASSEEIAAGVEEGNQRLEQMNNNPTTQNPVEVPASTSDSPSTVSPSSADTANNSSKKEEMPAIGNPGNDLQVDIANTDMDSAGLNAEQREQMISTYNQINNLQPGQSVVIDGTTYAKGNDGEITSENAMGKRTISDGKDGLNAGAIVVGENSRKIKLQKEDDEFIELYEKDQKRADAPAETPKPEAKPAQQHKAEPPVEEKKPEVDTTTPGAKWSKTVSYSGNGAASREKISYERNADNTITEYSVRGTRILDEDGHTPIKEKSKNGGLNQGSVEIDYKAGTKTTDISSMKGIESAGSAVTKSMERNGGTVLDKDGNIFLTYKDGEFYNAKGKKVKPDKAYDMINKHKDDGIRYQQNIKKR